MSLDTGTLTGTNIPSIAARNVETRLKAVLDALQPAVEAFFTASGISATFYADGTGEILDLSTETVDLLTPIVGNDWLNFPIAYWTAEEDRLNNTVMAEFPDTPTAIIAVDHA